MDRTTTTRLTDDGAVRVAQHAKMSALTELAEAYDTVSAVRADGTDEYDVLMRMTEIQTPRQCAVGPRTRIDRSSGLEWPAFIQVWNGLGLWWSFVGSIRFAMVSTVSL